jgi:hypothetical protein
VTRPRLTDVVLVLGLALLFSGLLSGEAVLVAVAGVLLAAAATAPRVTEYLTARAERDRTL